MKTNKVKRIAAITGIVLILSMYVISFVSALFATKYSHGLFAASIFSTIVIPIMVWWFITVYKWVHKNDNPPQPDHPEIADKSENKDK